MRRNSDAFFESRRPDVLNEVAEIRRHLTPTSSKN